LHSEIRLAVAAQRLRTTPERARRWVMTGKLVGRLFDGRWYVTTASVEQLEAKLRAEDHLHHSSLRQS
jgi:hypothetical protein